MAQLGLRGNAAQELILTPLPGDLNNDRIVNSLDSSILYSRWLSQKPEDLIYDLNKDGIINSLDWGILNRNWNRIRE